MASSLGRVLLNRPILYGGYTHTIDKGRTVVVMVFRRNLVKKPKSVIGSNIKTSLGMNAAKVSSEHSSCFFLFSKIYQMKDSNAFLTCRLRLSVD